MPTFQYRALQSDGTIAEGQLEAGGRQDAFKQMESRGLRPINVAEKTGAAKKNGSNGSAHKTEATNGALPKMKFSFGGSKKVSSRMLGNFTRLLSSLLAAGVPLSRALVILMNEATNPVAHAK